MQPQIDSSTFIIAEAGVNHNGDIDLAHKMIDAAADARADAIKFQTFQPENLVCRNAPKATYQLSQSRKDESQLEMLRKLVLPYKKHMELIQHCDHVKLMFLSSPFDEQSIDFLDRLGLGIFKIPSGEITNYPYLKKIGQLKKKIILSTGMSTIAEIETALATLERWGTNSKNITLLHCNTEYPTPFENVNLLAMSTMKTAFAGINVGFSDHTMGIEVAIAAVALGAAVIEKHFTLDKSMSGPDHKASLNPSDLKVLVRSIRNIEKSFGSGEKTPGYGEAKNIVSIRKSIVAAKQIAKNEVFSEYNLTTKRPGTGINPMRWPDLAGRKSNRTYSEDDPIDTIELD